MIKQIKINQIPSIKRFVRLMEISKKDDSYELSFLVSSKRNFNIKLTSKEFEIFKQINGINTLDEIAKISYSTLNEVVNVLDKFDQQFVLIFKKQNKNDQFDRRDLFFNDYKSSLSLERKIIFDYNTLTKQEISFVKNKINIGIFTVSSDLSSKLTNRVIISKKILENEGYVINLGKLWNKSNGYTTGSAQERANEFNNLLDHNQILMSMIGGMNSSSILPYIDYEKIRNNKTKIIGFSDTTAILLAVYNKTKLPTYYGHALLPSFNEQEYIRKWNLNSFQKYVVNNDIGIIKNPQYWTQQKINWFDFENNINQNKYKKKLIKNKLNSFNDGIVVGRLIGGNLNTMVSIYNTEFMPEIKNGDILFIEDSNKRIDECERNFVFLKNTKILNKVSAVIIGKCENFDPMGSKETYESLFMKFLDRKISVLTNFDCSHCQPMNILKIGGKIKLDTRKKVITLLD